MFSIFTNNIITKGWKKNYKQLETILKNSSYDDTVCFKMLHFLKVLNTSEIITNYFKRNIIIFYIEDLLV